MGTAIEEAIAGQVHTRWNVKMDQSWPDEWRSGPAS